MFVPNVPLPVVLIPTSLLFVYICYYSFFHPLSKFPGPRLASLTNLWKVYQINIGQYEYVLQDLHDRYGKIVRIGPNHLNIRDGPAVKTILGSGAAFAKSEFYNGFTAIRPNLFGTRDEAIHSVRRKAVANRFSLQSIAGMEIYMDQCLDKLVARLDQSARTGEVIDIKEWLHYYVIDVLGELAFSQSFGTLEAGNADNAPQLEAHTRLSVLLGQIPWFQPYAARWLPRIPMQSVRELVKGRLKLRQLAANSVNSCIGDPERAGRKNLLGKLLDELNDGEDSKGRTFDLLDVYTEAFGFIVAGSSTTAATLAFLLWHILRSADVQSKLRNEIDAIDKSHESSASFEYRSISNLKYLSACVSEGLRINPTFTLLFMRIVPPSGCQIADAFVPGGTDVSLCNYTLHHDPEIFGTDLDEYRPERWLDPSYSKQGDLLAFGTGHRACIGRNIAHVEMLKVLAVLFSRYNFEVITDEEDRVRKMPTTQSRTGATEIVGGLNVRLSLR